MICSVLFFRPSSGIRKGRGSRSVWLTMVLRTLPLLCFLSLIHIWVVFDITQGFVYGQLSKDQTHNSYVDIIGTKGVVRMTHDFIPCERYVNCGNPFCNRRILTSEENEDKYLRGCSHECRVHPRNRYVEEYNLSQAEVAERLAVIGETLDGTLA